MWEIQKEEKKQLNEDQEGRLEEEKELQMQDTQK